MFFKIYFKLSWWGGFTTLSVMFFKFYFKLSWWGGFTANLPSGYGI